ncbi:hypothetical protein SEA_LUCKYSOCKE_105 [Streptomyces phage LuckySocke]|jgi:hypothetical protein|nr:hypothetical protein SEA_ALONE_107 [Streptomyces phage Alone3]WPH58963.1 hypothetical protein SEA_LUCKYSOCKE_105 [Streptomyces phage LuckySocke]
MTEMLALGAPKLPSGYFYRIGMGGFGYTRLTIRRKRKIGSKEVAATLFHVDDSPNETAESLIVWAAEEAVKSWGYRKDSMARHTAMEKWMGDHK